ncbi:sulfatase-like hydrolase/transferase [Roseiarcaceae bacterium H3SJ34-1]|uniref:sulfatase-like hydrolase/transferase n=1 Tax=Terripilifer ovatus TaxID=3032367 RepID=UPI003AB945B7|nr:sulfatase-like hydrolase/transferase [Roseiarcaceae bacterium H3SJ34-1]
MLGKASPIGGRLLAFILTCWIGFIAFTEPDFPLFALVAAFFAALVVFLSVLSRRPGFGLAVATFVFVAVYVTSAFKFNVAAMNLHVYDVIFYLFSVAQLSFFIETYSAAATVFGAIIAVTLLLMVISFRLETPRCFGSIGGSVAAVTALAVLIGSGMALGARKPTFFDDGRHVFSAFIGSLTDLPALMRAKGFFEISAHATLSPTVAAPITCKPGKDAPDIVLFLNESAMPEGVYPQLHYPAELAPFFRSDDGRTHRLRVETFGGGTWLSDFSVLTGLPTNTFGNLRNFATQLMTGRLRHSLPQYLKACGYDTTMIYPSLAEFAGSGRFYRAIGFDRIIDRQVHHASDDRQRDAFYYDQVVKVLDASRAKQGESGVRRPQFIVASSMSTHSPWNFRFAPEMLKKGETTRWTGDAEFDEYLWRMVLAKRDRDAFRATLAQRFPQQPFLFVNYGDHQPALTRLPLAHATEIADTGVAWQLDPASRAFETYYAIEGLNFTLKAQPPDVPILEIPHLAALTVAAAGLPLDPVFERRMWLIDKCDGLYADCKDRGAVLAFQRYMLDSGWIVQP